MNLHLLLARPDRGPVKPITLRSITEQQFPPRTPASTHLVERWGDPNLLPRQRWALVVPAGRAGERLRSILKPLCELRAQQQQQTPAQVFHVPSTMTEDQARDFRDDHLHPISKPMRERPRYLLLAGGPDTVPQELEDVMCGDGTCFVGRIAFEREEAYEAYVEKVVRSETSPGGAGQARVVLASVADGDEATLIGHEQFVVPMGERCRAESRSGHFGASEVTIQTVPKGSADRFLQLASAARGAVLLTMSHGLGAPAEGWLDASEQRHRQGCLYLGNRVVLRPEDVQAKDFVPGGVWFYMACHGAGTPKKSVYRPWLERLVGDDPSLQEVLDHIRTSRPIDQPFVGSLAQAALANPRGPIAVIGHRDLAFSYSYIDPTDGRERLDRFIAALDALLSGRRAGVALHTLSSFAQEADDRLRTAFQADAETGRQPAPTDDESLRRAFLWLERHDLASYALLGDPAARIAVEGT